MGFMTIIKLQNDNLHQLRESPISVNYFMTTCAGMGWRDDESVRQIYREAMQIAEENNEPLWPNHAIQVVEVHHADKKQLIYSGGNRAFSVSSLYNKLGDDKTKSSLWSFITEAIGKVLEFDQIGRDSKKR